MLRLFCATKMQERDSGVIHDQKSCKRNRRKTPVGLIAIALLVAAISLAAPAPVNASCASLQRLAQAHANDMARRERMDHAGFQQRAAQGARGRERGDGSCQPIPDFAAVACFAAACRQHAPAWLQGDRPCGLAIGPTLLGHADWSLGKAACGISPTEVVSTKLGAGQFQSPPEFLVRIRDTDDRGPRKSFCRYLVGV
jgi:hypothetical protein